MTPLTPELRDALASEYVLGTQTQRVRRRLEKLIAEDPELAERVAWWESQLHALGDVLQPVPVPPWVWNSIEEELRPATPPRPQPVPAPKPPSTGLWGSLPVWRFATATVGAVAIYLGLQPPPDPVEIVREVPVEVIKPVEVVREVQVPARGGVVMVLTDQEAKTAWLVSRQDADAPLMAQPVQLPVLTVEQAYQLWLLPPGAEPIPVGMLSDQQATELVLPDAVDRLLQPGLGMAVSIEPPGGSPTGAPTGPIVFTGAVKEL